MCEGQESPTHFLFEKYCMWLPDGRGINSQPDMETYEMKQWMFCILYNIYIKSKSYISLIFLQVYINLINCNDFMWCIHMQDVCAYMCFYAREKYM